MDFTKIKKYPSQISTVFKRFPLAVAFAIFTTIAFIYVYESGHSPTEYKFSHWLMIYPIAASMIALSVSLVQESRKKFSFLPHIIAGALWLAISIALVLYFPKNSNDIGRTYVGMTYLFIYTTAFLSIFVAPFFKQKDENGFWVFLMRNAKAAVVAIAISVVLLIAIDGLLFGFFNLFDIKVSARPFVYSAIISSCTIFPILFFSGIPSIGECLQEAPALNKFQTSTNKFIFLPVVSLYILLLYAYIAKIIIQWEMPKGMVSYLVSASMLLMLLRVTLMLPERINPKQSFESKLLKILPAACIPLVILMSVGIIRRISDYGISEDRYYITAINIFYYAIIAILLIDKIKCKSRFIAIVFCSMFLIATNGPLSAINVTHRIWMGSIKDALTELGYTNFPLSKDETAEFARRIQDKSDHKTNIATSRLEILNSRHDKELAQYIPKGDALILISRKSSTNEKVNEFLISAYINNSKNSYFEIPKNATQVNHFYKTFNKEDYKFQGDTLFFQFSPKKLDKTFRFFVTKQALESKDVRFLETEGAKIGVENLDLTLYKKEEKVKHNYFSIRGILFLE
ncbi:DUF4153 domain-containing protein [Fibrobacter sp. UWB12]|uniref:DUF4153 domain-containing protein n=1 Tax=Fibrobacter sp. UWB12 TaxID=1896203 RepID=UPI000911458B|nr:DUF4153 domain-containing protein [Fibrobacter sp. UWB12]SHL04705.1 protein of unknown function [Fibrobacter sp. UWB12]